LSGAHTNSIIIVGYSSGSKIVAKY